MSKRVIPGSDLILVKEDGTVSLGNPNGTRIEINTSTDTFKIYVKNVLKDTWDAT